MRKGERHIPPVPPPFRYVIDTFRGRFPGQARGKFPAERNRIAAAAELPV